MKIKQGFELISGREELVPNIFPYGTNTLKAFSLAKEEQLYLTNLVKMYIRSRSSAVGADYVLRNLDKCLNVRLEDYPLPTFMSKDKRPCVNVSLLQQTYASDYTPADMYALYLNALMLTNYLDNKNIPDGIEQDVSNYIYAIFMKLFGKKSGLLGSYRDLIPKLRFLVTLYVRCGMYGFPDNNDTRQKTAASLYTTFDDLKMGYDFSTITGFINSLRDNQIIPLSTIKFSQQVVRIGGAQALPIFEDLARLLSTLPCSLVSGNSVYTSFWTKIPGMTYKKLVYKAFTILSRG